jgi:RNA polymerase primary sigma factor
MAKKRNVPSDSFEESLEERNAQSFPVSYPCTKVLLTLKEEIDLCGRAQAGDESARQKVMESNLRLVMSMARKYHARSMTYEDIVQEGIIGLLEAIKKYDGTKGFRFSTYASYWIRQSIVRGIEKTDRMIRLPIYGCNAERKVRQMEREAQDNLAPPPTVEEVAERTGLSRILVQALSYFSSEPLSLDVLFGDDLDTPFVEIIPDELAVDPEDNSVQRAAYADLQEAIENLPDKEQFVINRRFGFFDGAIWTLQDIAIVMDMSREGVRHVQGRALNKLRRALWKHPTYHPPKQAEEELE